MQRYSKRINNKQNGFTLVEVMIAALVLATGSAAFMKLQSIGIKSSFNHYARSQATTIAGDFIEQLRSNKSFVNLPATSRTGSIVGGATSLVAAPQANNDCNKARPKETCAEAILNYHKYLTGQQMGSAFQPNLSLLCFQTKTGANTNNTGYIRVTYVWRDSLSQTKTLLTASDCPTTFNAAFTTQNPNSITIYAQL